MKVEPACEAQGTADRPQHHDKGRGRQEGGNDPGNEIDGRFGGDPQVFRKTGLGVLVVALHEVQLVVTAVGKPARYHGRGQPGAPPALHRHPQINLGNDKAHAAKNERHEHGAQDIDGVGVALFDGVEDGAVPDIDPVLEADIDADQDQQPDGQRPAELVAVPSPVTAPADPETPQQVFLARLLGFLGRQFRIGFDGFRWRSFADHFGRGRFDDRCLLTAWLLLAWSFFAQLLVRRR